MKRFVFCILLLLAIAILAGIPLAIALAADGKLATPAIPHRALTYRSTLIRETRQVWGLDGPVATQAAQIQQESGWDAQAHSAVAAGLAEFTPQTATWISGAYPDLGAAAPYNPAWALRALVTYDHDLWGQVTVFATACDRMAFTLSAYNGGLGWVFKDQALAKSFKVDPAIWWGHVELFTKRSAGAMKENRAYPRRILLLLQPAYAAWGEGVDCSAVAT